MVLAYEQANKDRQMKDLYLMFTRLDQDGSGCVIVKRSSMHLARIGPC